MAFERVSRLASIPALLLLAATWVSGAVQANAQSLIRDPDIEYGLRELAFPVLRAAGLNTNRVQILVVNDSTFNAFVIDYNAIYLNYGLILTVDTPEMLQAVIAHEAAHIANGHLSRRIENLKTAQRKSKWGTALALMVAAAGGGEAALGIAAGSSGAALRSFLGHTRAEESAADRSAASYLRAAGISPIGMVDLHRKFAGQELLSTANQDPYMRSHPTSRERLRAAEDMLETVTQAPLPNQNADYWFARAKGKLSAFLRPPAWTMQRAQEEPAQDVRLMREAAAYHRNRDLANARRSIDAALTLRPDDPFYYELKGQILLESRQVQDAVKAYQSAVDMAPHDALLLAGYGRALLTAGRTKEALKALEQARARDHRNGRLLQDLGHAYARVGNTGMASAVTAERYALQGKLPDAAIHAKRALGSLPEGSPGWQRAQDVLIAAEHAQKKRRN